MKAKYWIAASIFSTGPSHHFLFRLTLEFLVQRGNLFVELTVITPLLNACEDALFSRASARATNRIQRPFTIWVLMDGSLWREACDAYCGLRSNVCGRWNLRIFVFRNQKWRDEAELRWTKYWTTPFQATKMLIFHEPNGTDNGRVAICQSSYTPKHALCNGLYGYRSCF